MPEKRKPLHIFRAGTHTDATGRTLEFSASDLEATARAYDPARHEAPIVVGHPKDNSPAYGWISSLSASSAGLAANELLADKGYDATWFRNALQQRGITACIPPKKNRKDAVPYDKELYKQRHKIEIMFGLLKDWRRISMRYDRCSHTFFLPFVSLLPLFFIFNES